MTLVLLTPLSNHGATGKSLNQKLNTNVLNKITCLDKVNSIVKSFFEMYTLLFQICICLGLFYVNPVMVCYVIGLN